VDHQDLVERSFDARTAAWAQWGTVEDDVLSHLVNPAFAGGPLWPNVRQAFRVVRRPGELLLASDGLSDPFDPDAFDLEDVDDASLPNGLQLEVYAVTADPLEAVVGSWLFDLVWGASQVAASRGDLAGLLEEWGLLSTELGGVDLPEPHRHRFLTEDQRVGVLLGLVDSVPPARVAGPLSSVRLVGVKLLTLPELAHAAEHGPDGRQELARRFTAQGGAPVSGLDRPSVV
jgi:hypothetical protein